MRISLALGQEIGMEIEREEFDWYGRVWASQTLNNSLEIGAVVDNITDYYSRAEQTDDPRVKAMNYQRLEMSRSLQLVE